MTEQQYLERLEIGVFVRNMRVSANLSVRKLAKLTGKSAATISKYEAGMIPNDFEDFERLLRLVVKEEIKKGRMTNVG